MKLINLYNELLVENANKEEVIRSINEKRIVVIKYDSEEPEGKGFRKIEPVAFGRSKSGNMIIRAYQVAGKSLSYVTKNTPKPGWRTFRIDKILTFDVQNATFNKKRPGYNTKGDRDMTNIITIAKF